MYWIQILKGPERGTYDRMQPSQGSADSQPGETSFGDGCVNDSLLTEAVEKTSGDFVSAAHILAILKLLKEWKSQCVRSLVLCYLFTEKKDLVVGLHLFGHCVIEGLADLEFFDAAGSSIVAYS